LKSNLYNIDEAGQWLQVTLPHSTLVTGVMTQGRANSNQWVTSYNIIYRNSETAEFERVNNEFGSPAVRHNMLLLYL